MDSGIWRPAAGECFHCGLSLDGATFSVVIDDEPQAMCCLGCQAVAQAIVDNGLDDFYRHRTECSARPDSVVPDELQQLTLFDNETVQQSFVRDTDDSVSEASLIIEGVVCAACVWLIEHHLQKIPGVLELRVNLTTHRANVVWDKSQLPLSKILAEIRSIGYQAHPFDANRLHNINERERKHSLRRIAIAGIGMMQVMMTALALYIGEADMGESARNLLRWIGLFITTPVLLFASSVFFRSAWRELKRFRLGMDVPVSIAMITAYSASVWATVSGTGEVYYDSVTMFTFFLLLGRFLEMNARHHAGKVADELVRLLPAVATRLAADGSTSVVSVSELQLGDRVLIRPGETVPADGLVADGESTVNEAVLSGESVPVLKYSGDALTGGTVNVESPLVLEVQAIGESTVLSSIIRLLDRAQMEKPKLARLADSVAAWFVLVILITAALVFGAWWFYDPDRAFWVTIAVLVVTCPCALSLATPVALTTATSSLTRMGVLTTRGHALEGLSKATDVVFDKTGTLTTGQLQVSGQWFVDYWPKSASGSESSGELSKIAVELSPEQALLALAAGLESASEHPIARAVIAASTLEAVVCKDQKNIPGRGVEGVFDGVVYRIGTKEFIEPWLADGVMSADLEAKAGSAGINTRIYMANKQQLLAILELQDQLRADAVECVATLKAAGMQVTLLSGDKQSVADHIGKKLGIDTVIAEQLPDQKLAYLKSKQDAGQLVIMVGDGVNDAPVLAAADVSIAMGEGSQLAQVTADMVLMSDSLKSIPQAIHMAKRTRVIIRENFAWAILYNLLAMPMATLGLLAPWMAAIGMSLSSLLVVLNALRLKR